MISAVSEQFNRFVTFAEDQRAKGAKTAIATMGDVAAKGDTPLEERAIKITEKSDWVGNVFFRKDDAKAVNNEVRALFRKTVADMFGGESHIPDSVKDAMLMKDYGCGKPLTARRIIAVRDAIVKLGRANGFDNTNKPNGVLANKAYTAGYTRKDFGKINTAANLLAKTQHLTLKDAIEEVVTKGSAGNRVMTAGALYLKDEESFRVGYDFHRDFAADDARNRELARDNAGENSVSNLAQISENLRTKFEKLLDDAEKIFTAAKPSDANVAALSGLKSIAVSTMTKFRQLADQLKNGALTDRAEINKKLFYEDGFTEFSNEVGRLITRLKPEAAQNPAIADFCGYLNEVSVELLREYDALRATYKEAVVKDMIPVALDMLKDAASLGRIQTASVPKALTDNLEAVMKKDPFAFMNNLKGLCNYLSRKGDGALHFSDDHKKELTALLKQTFNDDPKVDKMLARIIDKFETSFYVEFLVSPNSVQNEFLRPDFVVEYLKAHPETLSILDLGFNLDDDQAVKDVKSVLKENMAADIQKSLARTSGDTSLSSGVMPQAVREYNRGYVTFNGENIPCAMLGKAYPSTMNAVNPERKGYVEFLETKFDDNHKKMRQMVSYTCGMVNGLSGAINKLIDNGGDKSHIKGNPRQKCLENGAIMVNADRLPEENYDITIAENGDVTITFTHILQNKLTSIMDMNKGTALTFHDVNADQQPILSAFKLTTTMTIKNATDAELGNKMPEFTIDEIQQEAVEC